MKKRSSLMALVAFFAVTAHALTASAYDLTFSDIPLGLDTTVAVEYLVSVGTIKGYDDGTFRPGNLVNRAELMKILVSGQGINPQPGEYTSNCFPDVQAGAWYEPYVCYAYDQGWVSGYPDGLFRPGDYLNRAEGDKMIVNGMGFGDPSNVSYMYIRLFDDVQETDWFAPYIEILRGAVIDDIYGSYYPGYGMTREIATDYIFRVRVVQATGVQYYDANARLAFLTQEGKADMNNLAYTANTSDDSSASYSVTMSFSGSCSNPNVTITNYSGATVDFSSWYLEPFSGSSVYPFSGVSLSDGESITVSANSNLSGQSQAISLRSDDGAIQTSDWCN